MDVVDWAKYLYKRIEERQQDLGEALSHGSVKDWEQYKMSVGEIRGLSFAGEKRRRCRRLYIFLTTLRRK